MKWNRMLARHGYIVEEAGVAYDPFAISANKAKTLGIGIAKVSFTVGTSREYGEVKCSATVTLECPQTETDIDMAGEAAYRKALELTNDAASQLEIPKLPPFQEPS